MKRLNIKGFTLIELIMVIVIIAILAIVAIPKYLDIQDKARVAAMKGVVGGIRSGIHIWRANSIDAGAATGGITWPSALDSENNDTVASETTPLFGEIMEPAIAADWTKKNNAHYVATGPVSDVDWYYHSDSGKFNNTWP